MSTDPIRAHRSVPTAAADPSASSTRPSHLAARREQISFLSAGQRCDGWVYQPAGPGPHPCLVMAHGLGGVRGGVLPDIAACFAAAGIAILVFDYRYSGTSAGLPRGLVDISKQRDDYRAAVAYARRFRGVDARRIALWGTSFSGGHVLSVAAEDPGIAAAIIQNPFVDGRCTAAAAIRSAGRLGVARLTWEGLRDQLRRRLGWNPHRVALVGPPEPSP
ncbi:alpha/beta hydrolase [Micromonospora sp. NPDC049204]|uniref:alpha/beta hydrolase n=1 Tax=Micromonospora sp. NPDC049204 TaxID=3154351 RepID=UPI0033DE6464